MRSFIYSVITILLTVIITSSEATTRKVPQDYPKIQLAINAAVNGDTVLVAEGTYYENICITKKIVVASLFITDNNKSHITNTIINGSTPSHPDSGSVVTIEGDVDTTTIIKGFTITGGKGNKRYTAIQNIYGMEGGGIDIYTTGGARISNNIIRNNSIANLGSVTETWGGGIAAGYGSVVSNYTIIEYNTIFENSTVGTYGEGGGIVLMTHGRLTGNSVLNNTSTTIGGGISILNGCILTLEQNYISGNNAAKSGGGMIAYYYSVTGKQPTLTLINNIIVKNTAQLGSAMRMNGGDLRMIHNTIADNSASTYSIHLGTISGSSNTVRLLNNIVWSPLSSNQITTTNGTIYSSNNCVYGGLTGTDNISTDPSFALFDTLYNLSSGSPCIGAGVLSVSLGNITLNAPLFDYLNKTRPRAEGTKPDIGAVENNLPTGVNVESNVSQRPDKFSIEQNYPNPFNPTTVIRYQLPMKSKVSLRIYDLLGSDIATLVNEEQSAGWKEVQWNAKDVSSGIYFYRIDVNNNEKTVTEMKKCILLK
jgi:hypothetical protein